MPFRCEPDAEPIPGYRLIARIGGGGFGEIWSCRTQAGDLRAIKIAHGDLAASHPGRRTAEQELHGHRRVGDLRHSSLLSPERIEVLDGQLLIVMELADGSLWDRFRECCGRGMPGIPRDDLLRYLADVAAGLDCLRDAHLQHLDIKPQNLLLVGDRVKVCDFGLVADLRSGSAGSAATPIYSAPETFAGALSPQSDQYSLAIVYQELLTGISPFAGSTPEQLARQHLTATPNLAPLPPADRAAVERALAKKPADRFPSCAAFVEALRSGTETSEDRGRGTEDKKQSPLSPVLCPLSSGLPTVVIGIGGVGGAILRRLRRMLGPADVCPVRLLFIDTDADTVRDAIDSGELNPAEVLPTPLQRADHYTRRWLDSKTPGWFDAAWLARLSPTTTPDGCRGLGRLAFADHIVALRQKIEADLSAVSHLGGGPPRVIIAAGLAGGTGSGMILDAAFLVRHLLRRLGGEPAVAGWLLMPPADTDDRSIANAFAALAELRHFGRPETTYRARCDDPAESLTTKDAPFEDVVVLTDVETAATGLARELLFLAPASGISPEGAVQLSPGRKPWVSDAPSPASPEGATQPVCRTFGQARLMWPRRAILLRAAGQMTAALIDRWTCADTTAVAGPVRSWLAEQWSSLELGPDALASRLARSAAVVLGRPVEEAIAAAADPASAPRPLELPEVRARLDQLTDHLAAVLSAATDGAMRESSTRLARPVLTLIERPDFRLAAAEVAVGLLAERFERSLAYVGPAAAACRREAEAAGSADPTAAARWRYQSLLLRQTSAIYGVLRGRLGEVLAEVRLCRERLAAVAASLPAEEPVDAPPSELLLPSGCETVADAAGRLKETADELRELERHSQRHLADSVGGLARACLIAGDLRQTLAPPLVALAEAILAPRLADGNAAEAFLAANPDPVAALRAMGTAAAPPLAPSAESTTVICPEPLADLARHALGSDIAISTSADEIVIVRWARLPLTALPLFGPAARAAFQRRKVAGGSPHARIDVPFAD